MAVTLISLLALILIAIVVIGLIVAACADPSIALGLGILAVLGLAVSAAFLSVRQDTAIVEAEAVLEQERNDAEQRRRETLAEAAQTVFAAPEDFAGSIPKPRQVSDEAPLTEPEQSSEASADTDAVADADAPRPVSIREVIHSPNRGATAEKTLDALPEWVREPNPGTRSDDRFDLTLSSQRFATVEEAREQLWSRLVEQIRVHQREKYPEMAGWNLEPGPTLNAGILQRVCIVGWPLEVGGFEEEVYQLHWDVQLNDRTRQRLYAAWRPQEIQKRLTWLGSALGGVTLLLGTTAFALRRRPERTGRNRAATVGAVAIGIGTATLLALLVIA
jgi:hypothetical protein